MIHKKINCFDMRNLTKQNWLGLWKGVTWIALQGWAMDCSKHMWLKSFKWVSNKQGHNVWLKLSAVPQEASGTAPQSRVCVWNTNRGFTSDHWVSTGRGDGCWLLLQDLATFLEQLFLICWTWPPLAGANWTDNTCSIQHTVNLSVCLWGRWGGVGECCCKVPDGLMGS